MYPSCSRWSAANRSFWNAIRPDHPCTSGVVYHFFHGLNHIRPQGQRHEIPVPHTLLPVGFQRIFKQSPKGAIQGVDLGSFSLRAHRSPRAWVWPAAEPLAFSGFARALRLPWAPGGRSSLSLRCARGLPYSAVLFPSGGQSPNSRPIKTFRKLCTSAAGYRLPAEVVLRGGDLRWPPVSEARAPCEIRLSADDGLAPRVIWFKKKAVTLCPSHFKSKVPNSTLILSAIDSASCRPVPGESTARASCGRSSTAGVNWKLEDSLSSAELSWLLSCASPSSPRRPSFFFFPVRPASCCFAAWLVRNCPMDSFPRSGLDCP